MSSITMTNVDPGEGSPLQTDNYLAVYGGSSLLDIFYPVGTSYTTYDITFDPNVSWGGVWVENTDFVLCAYVKLDGTTIKSSKNISRVVRSAVGQLRIYLSSPMEDMDGIIQVSGETTDWASEIIGTYWESTTRFVVDCANYNATHVDPNNCFINVYGRLETPEYRTWRRTA